MACYSLLQRNLPNPGIELGSSVWQADSSPSEPPGNEVLQNTHKKRGGLRFSQEREHFTNEFPTEKSVLCPFGSRDTLTLREACVFPGICQYLWGESL